MKVSASVSGGGMVSPARAFAAFQKAAGEALFDTVKEIASEIEGKGRADIGQAGNFGGSWTEGFQAEAEGDLFSDVRLNVTMDHAYWKVFQYGATIKGRPLLYFKPTKAVGGLTGMDNAMPEVISKHEVTIPKKFHLIEIAQTEAAKVPPLFRQKLAEARHKASGG